MTLTLSFQGQIFKKLYFTDGKVGWLGTKATRVRYDVGPTMQSWTYNMGLSVGYSTYQIHWPSNGLVQNCYSFQPVGPLSQFSIYGLRVLSFFERVVSDEIELK